jgi:hypothetical protein
MNNALAMIEHINAMSRVNIAVDPMFDLWEVNLLNGTCERIESGVDSHDIEDKLCRECCDSVVIPWPSEMTLTPTMVFRRVLELMDERATKIMSTQSPK